MATVSFLNLDQAFSILDSSVIEFSAIDAANGGFQYSYASTGGDDWEFAGSGITNAGGAPTGGTVNTIQLDLDNDGGAAEFSITGLSVSATSFGINSGSADQQRNSFWFAALAGADTFDFTAASYVAALIFAADGANVSDGLTHNGADDTLNGGAQSLGAGSIITGDYFDLTLGSANGGDDLITVGALSVYGDFRDIGAGVTATGGDDVLTPGKLGANVPSIAAFIGDALSLGGTLVAGDDLIDLRLTDTTGFTKRTRLVGDVLDVSSGSSLTAGNDTIHGTSGDDGIYGDFFGNAGTVIGGNDDLYGYAGDDIIEGGTGDDTIRGGTGADFLDGGAGNDALSYQGSSAGVTVDLSNNTVSGGDAAGDTITGFEHVYGSTKNDVITGSDGVANDLRGSVGNDSLTGLSGNDTLDGGSGNDTLIGGDNPDILVGGAGADVISGGASVDKADYTKASTGVNASLATGGISGDAAGDSYTSIEILSGSNYDDTLTGSSVNDDIRGRGGSDIINGGAGNDKLLGYSGNDTIDGGAGDDTLTGGGHNDHFVFSGDFGHDTIADMNAGALIRDVIEINGFGAAFDSFAEILAATTDVGGDAVITINGSTITLTGVTKAQLDANDFIFG